MNYCYRFPVVKGLQAGRTYYIAMVPLKALSKLFPDDEDFVLPEYRAQRRLNQARIPEIKKYILNNRESYVFSALAASIDGKYEYISENQDDLGILEIDINAKFLINDGQHRKAAILAALKEAPELENETISVVFYEDLGLSRSQQMFTDLNKHAVKTSNSIAELYDSRDLIAVATRNVVSSIPFLEEYVDKEKDNLGKFSSALFALNNFYVANKKIVGKKTFDSDLEKFLLDYWGTVVEHMLPWQELLRHELTKKNLREQYIASQAVIIKALGRVGNGILESNKNIELTISRIEKVNWRRNASIWKGRVIRNDGKMLTSTAAVILAANMIKKIIGLELTDDEIFAEQKFENQ